MSSGAIPYAQNDGSEDGDGQVPDPSLQMNGSTPASALRSELSFGSNPLFAGDEDLAGKVQNVHLGMMVLQVISALMLTT